MLFSEPKIPQSSFYLGSRRSSRSFSALQRAENSSIAVRSSRNRSAGRFQCSSASRKFLNPLHPASRKQRNRFSALQRAENSSIKMRRSTAARHQPFQCSSASRKFLNSIVSRVAAPPVRLFQCSSASRKFLNRRCSIRRCDCNRVSVLFSEPKIPQYRRRAAAQTARRGFSALQRAENSSIDLAGWLAAVGIECFSALQRAENSSIKSPTDRAPH